VTNILVIDLGTQSLRGTLFSQSGQKCWSAIYPVDSDIDGDRYEQDPHQWSELLQRVLDEVEQKPATIVMTAPLAGLVCIDSSGHVLHPAIMYADRRSAPYVEAVEKCTSFDSVGQETGLRPYVSDPLPQMLWLKHHRPEVYKQSAHILDATGFLNWQLTGQPTLDYYTAMRCYNQHVIAELGLDATKLGRRTQLGERIGDWQGVPVVAATYDSKCAYIGSGIQQPGDALDISGTVTSFGVVTDQRVIDPLRRIYSVPLQDQWLVRGSTAMSGGILEWARRELIDGSFEEFDALVNLAQPGAGGVIFLPYLAGERAPLWNPHAAGSFQGITLATRRAELARAVYEGLSFALRHIIQVIHEHNIAIKDIRLAGGLSQNDTLNQIKADVLGIPLLKLQDYELTSLGAARIANNSIAPPSPAQQFTPNPQNTLHYDECFDNYLRLVNQLTPTFTATSSNSK
jgi:xylulokinase